MKQIMNKESNWDHNVEGDAVEGLVDCACRDEVLQALNEIKTGKALGPSDVLFELIAASVTVGIQVRVESCQSPRWIRMPVELVLSIVVPIFKGKVNISNCSSYKAVNLIEHGIKVMERVFE